MMKRTDERRQYASGFVDCNQSHIARLLPLLEPNASDGNVRKMRGGSRGETPSAGSERSTGCDVAGTDCDKPTGPEA
jgi:hypothetical protein